MSMALDTQDSSDKLVRRERSRRLAGRRSLFLVLVLLLAGPGHGDEISMSQPEIQQVKEVHLYFYAVRSYEPLIAVPQEGTAAASSPSTSPAWGWATPGFCTRKA